MNKKNIRFLDKTGVLFAVVILGILAAFLMQALDRRGSPLFEYLLIIAFIAFVLTQFHLLPLRIENDKIYLASPKFPSFGRKAVPFNEIKKIKITGAQQWDETKKGTGLKFIRVEDAQGRKYRNIVYSIDKFKKLLNELIGDGKLPKDVL